MNDLANIEQTELDLERSLSGSETSKRHHELYDHCLLCGSPQKESHHIVLLSAGGSDTSLANRAMLCGDMGNGCHKGAHGIDAGNGRWWIKRDDGGKLLAINRDNEQIRMLDEKPHLLTEVDGEAAFALHTVVINAKAKVERGFYELGSSLLDMKKTGYYLALGHTSWHDYLSDSDLSLGKTQAQKCMDAVAGMLAHEITPRELEKDNGIPLGIERVALVFKNVDTREEALEALEKAKTYHWNDLVEDLTGKTQAPPQDILHDHKCSGCGKINWYQGS